jgi:hypothetical protein
MERAGAPALREDPGPKAANYRVGLYCGPPAGRPSAILPWVYVPRRDLRNGVHKAHEKGRSPFSEISARAAPTGSRYRIRV